MTTTTLPSCAACKPLPASKRSSACWALRLPDTAGALLPATRSGCTINWKLACRASSFRALPRGWAGKAMAKVAAFCACKGAAARVAAMATTMVRGTQ